VTDAGTALDSPSSAPGTRFDALALVAFAPPYIREDLRKVRSRCAPSSGPMPDAHVTVRGGITPTADLAAVAEAIRATVHGVNPFTLRTTDARVIWNGDRASIVLPLEESPRLLELHARLTDALGRFGLTDQPGGYFPRVTVVQNVDPAGVERSVREVEGWRLNYFWTVRDVDLIGRDNSPIWRSIQTIRFGRA
jgi:2'-5' RNA ligase